MSVGERIVGHGVELRPNQNLPGFGGCRAPVHPSLSLICAPDMSAQCSRLSVTSYLPPICPAPLILVDCV